MNQCKTMEETDTRPDRGRLIPTIVVVMLVMCGVLAVGWLVHCSSLKNSNQKFITANDKLDETNQLLRREAAKLEGRLASITDQAARTTDELMAMNRTLGDTNEALAAEVAGIRKNIETRANENLKLIDLITQLHEDARRRTTESAKWIEELTQATVKLTDDAIAANARLDGLVAQLQAKTDEAAEQAIRINTLVEMVARLRVLAGLTPERQKAAPPPAEQSFFTDPNSGAPEPPA
ncbi:MAG: hypothetical protein IH624_01260 [Phycisphaerae bacterium]|nr:hypothetical protein [Phycisphaerae bacterium]